MNSDPFPGPSLCASSRPPCSSISRRLSDRPTPSPDVVRSSERSATLYLPNSTVWFAWEGGWREVDRDDHGLGEVPVVPIVNRGRLRLSPTVATPVRRIGQSELAPILPLSDAANKIATDMMLGAEFVALPLRGFWGIGPDDLVDEQGNKLTALQAIMGRVLTMDDPSETVTQYGDYALTVKAPVAMGGRAGR